MNNTFQKEYDATVEDIYKINIKIATGEEILFKIYDTAGEEDYINLVDEWIKVADGFLLVYAVNDKESLKVLENKYERIEKNNKGNVPIIVVGNKCDLEDQREITREQGMEFATKIGAKYYETSALTDFNKNCKVIFQTCADMIINNINSEIKKRKKKKCNIY